MASEVQDWATTAAGNNTGTAPSYPVEGQSPSSVNDTMREMMSAVARWLNDTNGTLTSTGSANAYALTTNRTLSAYADGDTFLFEANFTNSGAATLNCDTVGAIDIEKKDGEALAAGDILSGGRYIVVYDSTATAFHLLNPTLSSLEGPLLHTDGTERVAPTAAGADVTGTVFDVSLAGTNSVYVRARNNEGGIAIRTDDADGYIYQTDSAGANEDIWMTMAQNAGVTLNHNNTARVASTSTGAEVNGTIFDVNLAAVNSVYIKARNTEGGVAIRADGGDGYIYQTDSSGVNEDIWVTMAGNGAVTLNYDNSARVATSSAGATVTGTLNATTALTAGGVAALLAGGEVNDLANADKSLGTNGYYTMPDGFTIQWGTANIGGNSTGTAVSLPTTFTTAYSGQCTVKNYTTTNAQDTNHSVVSITTTQITISSGIDTAQDYYWVAYGYIAP